MLKNKTILYIVHNYNTFQKDPIEEVSKHFKKVYVLVRYKPISKIVKYLPFKSLKIYEDSYVVDLNNVPNNVEIIKTPVWYLPFGIFYKWAGYLHLRSVKRAIKKNNIKFDLIHSHFTWTSGYVGMKLKEKYNKPFVVTGHGFDIYDMPFQNEYWKRIICGILESANRIITVSKKNRDCIQRISKRGSIVISNCYNDKLFYPMNKQKLREKLDIRDRGVILLSVGALEEEKGHKYLIEAINILLKRQKYSNLKLYIIGGGSLNKSLEDKIKRLNLGENIVLLGQKPHEEISAWMNTCNLFILPSIAESFGIVQIEAFACGKPVVATKNEGSKEIIISEEYGFLCNIADSEDLANKINKALKKDWDKEKIIEYSEKFKQENIIEELVKLYNQLLTKK